MTLRSFCSPIVLLLTGVTRTRTVGVISERIVLSANEGGLGGRVGEVGLRGNKCEGKGRDGTAEPGDVLRLR